MLEFDTCMARNSSQIMPAARLKGMFEKPLDQLMFLFTAIFQYD